MLNIYNNATVELEDRDDYEVIKIILSALPDNHNFVQTAERLTNDINRELSFLASENEEPFTVNIEVDHFFINPDDSSHFIDDNFHFYSDVDQYESEDDQEKQYEQLQQACQTLGITQFINLTSLELEMDNTNISEELIEEENESNLQNQQQSNSSQNHNNQLQSYILNNSTTVFHHPNYDSDDTTDTVQNTIHNVPK